ncbi:hypothetical protein GOP47_0000223 [Adiantum capillus-veneris]|uniref:B30.2/SPRY domain-containing protein n=1 Tax=Adiantum capillus-veneris TaxID=13818 RepID=A0A9D4ZQD2_ADICA|nr:hypothetical protein GOP47_0000223 [Adiantum capillus-veneris]
MDPSLVVAVVLKLMASVYNLSLLISSNNSLRRELDRFHRQLQDKLDYLEKTLARFACCPDFTPKSLETLKDQMKEFHLTAKKLRQKKCCLKEEPVRSLRDEVMATFQMGMDSAVLEVVLELCKRTTSCLVTQKHVVDAILDHVHDWECPKLHDALSSFGKSTKTLPEHLKDVLHSNKAISTPFASIPEEGQQQEAESGGQSRENKVHVVEKVRGKLELIIRRSNLNGSISNAVEKKQGKEGNIVSSNPNRSMSFEIDQESEESGRLELFTRVGDGKIEVTFKGGKSTKTEIGTMVGIKSMKVSKELNYFYYEVEVVNMVELSGRGSSETSSSYIAGVAVGLAKDDKIKKDRMVGWYRNSLGYHSRDGVVYCNGSPAPEVISVGRLANGDKLGIGLLALPGKRPVIFFVKDGHLAGHTGKLCDKEYFSSDLLYPVVTVSSRSARLCVDFCGPFHLPSGADLAAALGL